MSGTAPPSAGGNRGNTEPPGPGELAAPGDVIRLRAGSYRGPIYVNKPDLTIESHAGERATLTAPADANNF